MEEFKVEESLGHLVAKVHQIFSSRFKEKLKEYNITPPQFGTLAFLWHHEGISQIQLAYLTRKDRTTTSGIIDRLEKENLVMRKSRSGDRRTHLIYVTKRGRELQSVLENIATGTNLEVTSMLTQQERELLRSLLKKILNNTPYEGIGEGL